mmetsp:Transcript_18068/g.37631  ORF Transcript_18068/g.37631 Transcript_18068/m.37631 type:complete len:274 (+) Transcript_18068:365-1186(+)
MYWHIIPLRRWGQRVESELARRWRRSVAREARGGASERSAGKNSPIHADELDGEGVTDEFLLNLNGVADNLMHAALGELVNELLVKHAGKITVQTLIPGDELVGETKARHEAALLEPEDGTERSGEENSLNGGEGNAALGEGCVLGLTPVEGPVGLLHDAGDSLDGIEEVVLLARVLYVGVNEEGVCLTVDVLNGNLKTVEAPRFRDGDLGGKVGSKVLIYNAITSSEECKDVRNKVTLVGSEGSPVLGVMGEVNLLSGPEGSLSLLVHLPDL